MKYIIASKNQFEGTSTNDAASPLNITEIATELIISRLRIIDMFNTNQIDENDTIVTMEERKCLYSKIFNNVLNQEEYGNLKITENVIDLIGNDWSTFNHTASLIPYKPFYQNYERDKKLISNIDWNLNHNYDLTTPFICLLIRTRGAWPEKNMSNEFWNQLITKLKENNIKTYIFGKETENYCDNNLIKYVKNFQDWCTIVKNENCKHIGSTMSGGVYPALIFGNDNIHMTLIDNINLMSQHAGDPSFYDDCINFSKVKIKYIYQIPTIEEFYGKITTNL